MAIKIRVVNMIPQSVSNESNEDCEPDLAVHSVNPWAGGRNDVADLGPRRLGVCAHLRLARPRSKRYLPQPPSQHTCQSPKREPNVTGVRRRMNLVSSCIVLTQGQHIHCLRAE
jgi:hypothetical protein